MNSRWLISFCFFVLAYFPFTMVLANQKTMSAACPTAEELNETATISPDGMWVYWKYEVKTSIPKRTISFFGSRKISSGTAKAPLIGSFIELEMLGQAVSCIYQNDQGMRSSVSNYGSIGELGYIGKPSSSQCVTGKQLECTGSAVTDCVFVFCLNQP